MGVPFPAGYDDAECYVVAINAKLVPYVAGMLQIMEKRGFWDTAEDFERGYNAIVALEGCMMATCMSDLIESNDRLYRMLDTAIFGTTYTVVDSDPLVVTPAIEPTHAIDIVNQDSLLGRLDRLTQLTDNTFNGTETPLYDYVPDVKTQLQLIIDGMGGDDESLEAILAAAQQIALLVA